MERPTINRQALSGVIIAAIFGIGWAQWGASGLTGAVAGVVRAVTVLLGAIILVRAFRLRRIAPIERFSMFASRGYRLIVVLEVIAIVAGSVLLNGTGHPAYVAVWIAAVVGVHFLGFGPLFARFYYLVGAIIVLGAVAALVVGLAGGGRHAIESIAGLVTAATLLSAAAWPLTRSGDLSGFNDPA
ncbi:MAG: hypothetical protein JOZ07_05645 [Solirubrobacterales bacterium]|nr:hypothetical protein [Solirubrobacterales bacterium]